MNSYGITRKNKKSFIKHPAGCFRGLMFTQKFGDILPPSRYSPFSAVLAQQQTVHHFIAGKENGQFRMVSLQ
mgnify:CR=1 FL=1